MPRQVKLWHPARKLEDDMQRKTFFILIAICLFVAQAVLEHMRSTETFTTVIFLNDLLEMGLLAGGVAMTAFVVFETRELRIERLEMLDDLATARRESSRWRDAARAHVNGLSQAIAAQFRTWGLTDSEADVAGLMLKGLAHKEIATLRQCSEATVRQHATVVYRKSGLISRSQLTAFFLEDLLMPSDAVPPPNLTVVSARRD
jgi:DNA-binding CsgD family transcriptional regulator